MSQSIYFIAALAFQLTDRLTHPNPEHIQLQQSIVKRLAPFQVHEKMIDEAAAPRRNRSKEMAPGEKFETVVPHLRTVKVFGLATRAIIFIAPRLLITYQIRRDCRENVDNWNTWRERMRENKQGWQKFVKTLQKVIFRNICVTMKRLVGKVLASHSFLMCEKNSNKALGHFTHVWCA